MPRKGGISVVRVDCIGSSREYYGVFIASVSHPRPAPRKDLCQAQPCRVLFDRYVVLRLPTLTDGEIQIFGSTALDLGIARAGLLPMAASTLDACRSEFNGMDLSEVPRGSSPQMSS